ncbi:MAG: alpha/beta hydrolase [Caldilineaceae bacterium]
MDAIEHKTISTNGINLHVAQAGSTDGELVILLHGFPEFWAGWKAQIPALAEAGLRIWAPDQRGYNLSDKPKDVAAYNLDELAKDVIGLIDAAGEDRAYVVGHDWGAAVAWWVAINYPDRVKKLAILNVPHPSVMFKTLRSTPQQMLKSWYIFFFQIPRLPEFLISRGNWRAGAQMMQNSANVGTFSPAHLDAYRKAWSQPGAFTAMINWYRALMRHQPPRRGPSRVTVPTLMIWGAHDVALDRSMAQPSIDYCDEGKLVFVEDATHWVQHDKPELVNRLLLDFLSDGKNSC